MFSSVTPLARADTANRRTTPRRWAIAIVLLITVCAGAVRLLTYDRFLPFVDYSDEAVYVSLADEIRGFSDQTALRDQYGLLAPLYVYTNVAVQGVYDALEQPQWHIPGEYFYAMRLLSVFFGVCTALTIAWTGWQLAGAVASVVGSMIWALSPAIIDFNSLAIPDPMLYLVCALAVATAIRSWRKRSVAWLALSLACGIAAIYIKLWLVTATLPFLIISVALAQRDRKLLPRVALLYGIAILFALHFLLVLNPFQSTVKVSANLEGGAFTANLFSVERIANNLWYLLYPVDNGIGLSLVVLLLGAAAALYCRRQRLPTVDGGSLLIIGIYLISTWWLSAGISRVTLDSDGRMRHILPASTAAIPLCAVCLILIARAGGHILSGRSLSRAWLAPVSLFLLAVGLLIRFMPGDLEQIARYSHPFTVNQVIDWFDSSPPRDGLALIPKESRYDALWNRLWGAYMGSKPYEWWLTPLDDIPQSTPAQYVARNIRWFVLSDVDFRSSQNPERLRAYLDQLLLVKTIPPVPGAVEGDGLYVYRFEPPEYPAEDDFGGLFRLIGYDLSAASVRPGDTIRFRPYWRLEGQPQQNLSMFVHLYPAASVASGSPVLVSQWDGEPVPNGNRPTLTWNDPHEVYFGEALELTVPADVAPGDYDLAVGLYDYLSQQRVTTANGATFYTIPLTVTANPG